MNLGSRVSPLSVGSAENDAGLRGPRPKRSSNTPGPSPIVTVRLAGLSPYASPVSVGGCTSFAGCTEPTGLPCCSTAAAADQRASSVCSDLLDAVSDRENVMKTLWRWGGVAMPP